MQDLGLHHTYCETYHTLLKQLQACTVCPAQAPHLMMKTSASLLPVQFQLIK